MEDLLQVIQQVQKDDDEHALEQIVALHESFILKSASTVSRRYITKSDDEWSIALSAFLQSVRDYQPGKGEFRSFAELVIRRRLIDYFKSQARHQVEISAAPEIFGGELIGDSPQTALQAAVAKKLTASQPTDLRMEIEAASQTFERYGFRFFDLASCSPKAEKTKAACARAAIYLLKSPLLLAGLRDTKQLPMQLIEKNAGVPRKLLDRHRKYIIAAVEILSGEYPALAEYMRFIRKELDG